VIRAATFNVSLYGERAGEVKSRLLTGSDNQAIRLAAIVQTVRPDILLVNEIDHDAYASTASVLNDYYFAMGRDGRKGIHYDAIYSAASNSGLRSDLDFERNERLDNQHQTWGFGAYEGQYAFAIYSRFPIVAENIRTFQTFRWSCLPNALRPIIPRTNRAYYSDEVWKCLRLSSKNHVDVPVRIDSLDLHLLASHPTPPVFDGSEDRNGCRNHDEINFWNFYLDNSLALVDDKGVAGGLAPDASFLCMGDLNSDPRSGASLNQAIRDLLTHPRLIDSQPVRLPFADVNRQAWKRQADFTKTDRSTATADFGRERQYRVDYVLPSRNLIINDAKVFWPGERDPAAIWTQASDHRLVWVDVRIDKLCQFGCPADKVGRLPLPST